MPMLPELNISWCSLKILRSCCVLILTFLIFNRMFTIYTNYHSFLPEKNDFERKGRIKKYEEVNFLNGLAAAIGPVQYYSRASGCLPSVPSLRTARKFEKGGFW